MISYKFSVPSEFRYNAQVYNFTILPLSEKTSQEFLHIPHFCKLSANNEYFANISVAFKTCKTNTYVFSYLLILLYNAKVYICKPFFILSAYSRVQNKRTGGNKHTGGIFSPKQ